MKIILCVDDKNGTMFNRRRQSQDRVLRGRLLDSYCSGKLWMNAYSARQFTDFPDRVQVSETFLLDAGEQDCCFVEDADPTSVKDKIDAVVLVRWNRVYPADRHFELSSLGGSWKLQSAEEFAGSSHEKITIEVYEK